MSVRKNASWRECLSCGWVGGGALHPCPAGWSKAAGEALVRAANSAGVPAAIVRPMGMYGDRDPYHSPNVLRGARSSPWPLAGMLMRIGKPSDAL